MGARRGGRLARERSLALGRCGCWSASSLHLTLCFLGSRPVAEVDALATGVRSCAERACGSRLGAPLWLPARRPRALAVEVHDRDGALPGMRERVSRFAVRAQRVGAAAGTVPAPYHRRARTRWRRGAASPDSL